MKQARTRIKICGITREQDALSVVQAGADALGLVFYAKSKRAVTVEQALKVIQNIPPFVTVTALFVNPEKAFVNEVLQAVPITLMQFHGNESPQFCQQFKRPYIKALRVQEDLDVSAEIRRYPGASGILLDTYKKGQPGGTGETFDWQRVPSQTAVPIILAGGLKPENVSEAILAVNPYGVDVSGGVEESPGIKSDAKVQAFIEQVQAT